MTKNIDTDAIIQLAEYVEMIGEHQTNNSEKTGAFQSAVNFYEIAHAKSDIFNMSRQFKMVL